mmetsp:Transcript_57867/g.66046  ORF Transcript_57867/g.66046 Transcript_57867/m.66046 type:complete len:229 (+) Transcript_57867:115-801(+)
MDPSSWYNSLPVFTKYYMTSAFVTAVCSNFKVISPMYLFVTGEYIFKHLQLWRLATNYIFFGGFGFGLIYMLMLINRGVGQLEKYFEKKPADFVMCLLFNALAILPFVMFFQLGFGSFSFAFAMLYVYCKKEPLSVVNFWGFAIKNGNFPFVLLVFFMLIGDDVQKYLLGLAVGHCYILLTEIVPVHYRWYPLRTPQWLEKMVPGPTNREQQPTQTNRAFMGRGVRIG